MYVVQYICMQYPENVPFVIFYSVSCWFSQAYPEIYQYRFRSAQQKQVHFLLGGCRVKIGLILYSRSRIWATERNTWKVLLEQFSVKCLDTPVTEGWFFSILQYPGREGERIRGYSSSSSFTSGYSESSDDGGYGADAQVGVLFNKQYKYMKIMSILPWISNYSKVLILVIERDSDLSAQIIHKILQVSKDNSLLPIWRQDRVALLYEGRTELHFADQLIQGCISSHKQQLTLSDTVRCNSTLPSYTCLRLTQLTTCQCEGSVIGWLLNTTMFKDWQMLHGLTMWNVVTNQPTGGPPRPPVFPQYAATCPKKPTEVALG